VVDAVNAVFREQPEGFEFVEHQTHQRDLLGHVLVLPLATADQGEEETSDEAPLTLRDPLTTPREKPGRAHATKSRAVRRTAASHRQRLVGE